MECAVGVPRRGAGLVRTAVVVASGVATGPDHQEAGATENGARAHADFAEFSTDRAGIRRRQRMMLSKADAAR